MEKNTGKAETWLDYGPALFMELSGFRQHDGIIRRVKAEPNKHEIKADQTNMILRWKQGQRAL